MIPGITAFRRRLLSAIYDPHWDNVVALLHLDGPVGNTSVVDETGRSWNNDAFPSVTLESAYPAFGPTSGLWNQNGSALRAENTDGAFNFGNQPFTLEAVVYMPVLGMPAAGVFSRRIGAIYCPFEFRISTTGYIEALISTPDNSTWYAITTFAGVAVIPGQQNHIAIVGTGTAIEVYVRGIKSSTTIPYTSLASTSQPFYIGRGGDGGYGGYIDEVRITKGIARYTDNFTPPFSAFSNKGPSYTYDPAWAQVVLLLHFDGTEGSQTITDSSSFLHTVPENAGALLKATAARYGATGLELNGGGGARVPVTHPSAFSITGAFTLEGQLRITATGDAYWYVAQIANSTGSHHSGFTMRWTDGGFGGRFQASMNDANRILGPTRAEVVGNYVHVAYCRDEDGWCRLFFNGILQGVVLDTTDLSGSNAVVIGGTVNNAYRFLGDMDEWRLTIGVSRYNKNFVPPTAPYPNLGPSFIAVDPHFANVVLLLHCDGASGSTTLVDSSPSQKTITANGGVELTTTSPLYGTASATLPSGGWIQTADSSDFLFGGDDFTAELAALFRSNPISSGGDYGICLIGQTFVSVTSRRWMIYISGSDLSNCTVYAAIYSSGGAETRAQATGVNLALNVRHTFAVSRNGNSLRLFINRVLVATANVTGKVIGSASQPLMIGRFNDNTYSYFMDGVIDEVRITRGVGRYTEDYAPQIGPFPDQGPIFGSPAFYDHIGADQTLVVPAGVTSINIKMWGAGGAGGSRSPIGLMDAAAGGSGGFTMGTLAVTPGETLSIIVGGGGTQSNTGTQNPRTYGEGGFGWGGGNQSGGAGGGRSAIRRGSIELATAGGGGGGGSVPTGNTGGAGGGSVGMDGQGDTRGTGGTQTTGGSASPASGNGAQLGAAFYGGNAGGVDGAGGGGGGGYYGGGGGGGNGQHGAGGGGGSGYVGGLTNASMIAGNGQTPGGASDPDRNGAGAGGGQRGAGTHGRVVITW